MKNKDFEMEFYNMWNKILTQKSLAFARYADGEVCLMRGIKIGKTAAAYTMDNWCCEEDGISLLGKDLKDTLYHTEPEWYYAISCVCCDPNGHEWLMNNIKHSVSNITYSNLWINSNYKKFISNVFKLNEPVFLIANKEGLYNRYPWNVLGYYPIEDDCINYWKNNKIQLINDVKDIALNNVNRLFFISAGPMSELIIHHMWEANKRNRYIDVGSSIDEFVKNRKTRPYMIEGSIYSKRKCTLFGDWQ